jgi:hypothetical protein
LKIHLIITWREILYPAERKRNQKSERNELIIYKNGKWLELGYIKIHLTTGRVNFLPALKKKIFM